MLNFQFLKLPTHPELPRYLAVVGSQAPKKLWDTKINYKLLSLESNLQY